MGFYDIDNDYSKNTPLTISSLCRKILEEIEEDDSTKCAEDIRGLIKNNKKTGIIDRIKKYLHYDIELHAKESNLNKFEMFQLIKILYYLEAKGDPKAVDTCEPPKKIKIINILSKPNLENITTTFSKHSEYGEYFDGLVELLSSKENVEDSPAKITFYINHVWEEFFFYELNPLTVSNTAINFSQSSLNKLIAIKRFLVCNILPIIEQYKSAELSYSNGVLYTFATILLSHFYLSVDAARLQFNNETSIPNVSYETRKRFLESEYKFVSLDIIDKLSDFYRTNKCDDENVKFIVDFIESDKKYTKTDIIYAISHLHSVINLISNYRKIEFLNNIDITFIIILIQEILSVKKDNIGYKNNYVGYNNTYVSLSRALLNFSEKIDQYNFNSIVGLDWETRIENRVAVSFNSLEHIKTRRDIDNAIYTLKSFIFSQKNVQDMYEVHQILFNTINAFKDDYFNEHTTAVILQILEDRMKEIFKK